VLGLGKILEILGKIIFKAKVYWRNRIHCQRNCLGKERVPYFFKKKKIVGNFASEPIFRYRKTPVS
jgi:hypothetical protein